LVLVALFALDALLFNTSLYSHLLEPESTSGAFELILGRERIAQQRNGDDLVALLGDSRFGCQPRVANELTPQTGLVFRNAGIAGSDARTWYYMMRDLDPTAQRYRALLIAVNTYYDEDEYFRHDNDIRALHYCIARLRFTDVLSFALSFHDPSIRWEAFRGALFKGIVYQADIQAFLSHPQTRLSDLRRDRAGIEQWTYNYVETDASLAGLKVDWATHTATFPPGADQNQKDTVVNSFMRELPPQDGRDHAFRSEWYGKIADRYRNSRTKIIFLRLPDGPLPRPEGLDPRNTSAILELAKRPNVLLFPEHAFDSLEHPELFKDGAHLNRRGVTLFSRMVAQGVAAMLGTAPKAEEGK
jgi:hypothetical protein